MVELHHISSAIRCPFCHAAVIPGQGEQQGCQQCHAWHHLECWQDHGGCSACSYRIKRLNLNLDTKALYAAIKQTKWFEESVNLARLNTRGPVYLIGSRLYLPIIEQLHGMASLSHVLSDWDFMSPKLAKKVSVPDDVVLATVNDGYGTYLRETKVVAESQQGCWKFYRDRGPRVELTNMAQFPGLSWWKRWVRAPTLNDYFQIVPLSFQAVALDIGTGELFGPAPALYGLAKKQMWVNNAESLAAAAVNHNLHVSQFKNRKAARLREAGFEWKLTKPKADEK